MCDIVQFINGDYEIVLSSRELGATYIVVVGVARPTHVHRHVSICGAARVL